MIVGETQSLPSLEAEAGAVLESANPDTTAMYIVSLGKSRTYI